MWAIRRASIHFSSRNRCLSLETTRICTVKTEIGSCNYENFITEFTQCQVKRRFHSSSSLNSSNSSSVVQLVSLLKDNYWPENRHDDELMFELDVSEGESDVDENKSSAISGLSQVICSASVNEVAKALDEWVEAGNEVTRTEVSSTVKILHRRQMYANAYMLYEWLESRHKIEFTECDYACRVVFIAKVQGNSIAEEYIQQIPESFRTEVVYNSLLRNYCFAATANKSEDLFNKMKDLFPLTSISCNQMLSLYKRTDQKKIAGIMEFMEKENIKPSKCTYQILIDVKGQSGNISEMEQIFEMMKSNGVEPSLQNRASLARYYAAAGLKDKADAVLKDIEGGNLIKNRAACYYLLPVYASLGRGDEVGRIWKECESTPSPGECIAALKAFGQLKRIEDAEAVFEKMSNNLESRPSSYLYSILLNVYADHKMVTEGEDLFRRMRERGANISLQAWDALIKLYIGVKEVEKAEAVLEEAIQQRKGRPRFASFMKILEGYAARGDVYNAEKIFSKMREAGHTMKPRPYHSLLYAYIFSKTPAKGFDKRLKEDNVVPDKKLTHLLTRMGASRSSVCRVR